MGKNNCNNVFTHHTVNIFGRSIGGADAGDVKFFERAERRFCSTLGNKQGRRKSSGRASGRTLKKRTTIRGWRSSHGGNLLKKAEKRESQDATEHLRINRIAKETQSEREKTLRSHVHQGDQKSQESEAEVNTPDKE